jgi:hypothetical protein
VTVARIHLETDVAAPVARVFDLARDIDLHQRSMGHIGERAIAGRTTGLIGAGESVTFRARQLGFLGRIADRLFLERRMRNLLETRNTALMREAEARSGA